MPLKTTFTICLFLLSLVPSLGLSQEIPGGVKPAYVIEIKDGDTLEIVVELIDGILGVYTIRVVGLDTPEKGGKAMCEQEKVLAQEAHERLSELVEMHDTGIMPAKYPFLTGVADVWVETAGFDSFGRLLARVLLRAKHDVADIMIDEGYGREWQEGQWKDGYWCE